MISAVDARKLMKGELDNDALKRVEQFLGEKFLNELGEQIELASKDGYCVCNLRFEDVSSDEHEDLMWYLKEKGYWVDATHPRDAWRFEPTSYVRYNITW